METIAVVLDEKAFRRVLKDTHESIPLPSPDRRTADAHRDALPGDTKAWLTNAEAMAYLGLSRITLQRYRDSGRLPYSKVGSNVYYRVSDIERLLEAGMTEMRR